MHEYTDVNNTQYRELVTSYCRENMTRFSRKSCYVDRVCDRAGRSAKPCPFCYVGLSARCPCNVSLWLTSGFCRSCSAINIKMRITRKCKGAHSKMYIVHVQTIKLMQQML